MIEAVHADLSIAAQCRLLSISGSSFYYIPQPESEDQRSPLSAAASGYRATYLHAFETGSELRVGLTRWIGYYNADRPHSGLAGHTPGEAYGADEVRSMVELAPPSGTLQLAA